MVNEPVGSEERTFSANRAAKTTLLVATLMLAFTASALYTNQPGRVGYGWATLAGGVALGVVRAGDLARVHVVLLSLGPGSGRIRFYLDDARTRGFRGRPRHLDCDMLFLHQGDLAGHRREIPLAQAQSLKRGRAGYPLLQFIHHVANALEMAGRIARREIRRVQGP